MSVQVHPDDAYAKKNENTTGKTECWIVLAAKKGEGIFLGLKKGVTEKEFFDSAEKGEDLSKLMRFFPVTKGDFFYVPAGTLHAIGKGVTIAEIQQPSGVTYRVWDWNRVDENGKSRELHLKQAREVSLFDSLSNEPKSFLIKVNVFQLPIGTSLINHSNFRVRVFRLNKDQNFELELKKERLSTIIICKGSLNIQGTKSVKVEEFNTLSLKKEQKIELSAGGKVEFLIVD